MQLQKPQEYTLALPNVYLIPIKLTILTNLYLSYEETTLNYF